VPILNSKSGLLDVATMTMGQGVEVHTLLNPAITPGKRIKINNQDVVRFTPTPGGQAPDAAFKLSQDQVAFKADGIYTVGSVRHWGQNRGTPWYSHIVTQPAVPQVGLNAG
jgi:hypothetical protein